MYEILGLKHVFSTFQETVWSHLKLPVSQGSVGVSNNQSAHGVMEALGTFGEH